VIETSVHPLSVKKQNIITYIININPELEAGGQIPCDVCSSLLWNHTEVEIPVAQTDPLEWRTVRVFEVIAHLLSAAASS